MMGDLGGGGQIFNVSLLTLILFLSGHAMVDPWLKRSPSPVSGHRVCDDPSKSGKGHYHAEFRTS